MEEDTTVVGRVGRRPFTQEVLMTGRRARFGIVLLAVVLLTLALGSAVAYAVAPTAPATLGASVKATAPAATAPAATEKKEGEAATATAPAATEKKEGEAAATGEAAAGEEKSEMDFKVGNLTEAQKTAIGDAGSMGVSGYNILIVGFLGVFAIVGIIAMGAFFQMRA
jgi:cobalamin biosynthesis Mg chelatase CobN